MGLKKRMHWAHLLLTVMLNISSDIVRLGTPGCVNIGSLRMNWTLYRLNLLGLGNSVSFTMLHPMLKGVLRCPVEWE